MLSFLDRRSRILALALMVVASCRIVATYTVFNHTADEPTHIACGMEWLDRGTYQWGSEHPPLARVAAALGPYLLGSRWHEISHQNDEWIIREGLDILYDGHEYDRKLALARLGILPFFWFACAVVYLAGERYFGRTAGVLALFLFSFLPPVLAHAGLATTDMALTAFTGAAFLSGVLFWERPTWQRALCFGAATAGGMLSKYSFFVFFPATMGLAAVTFVVSERRTAREWLAEIRARLPGLALAIVTACIIVWAGYRFSLAGGMPAPELIRGIRDLTAHNTRGHPGYLLGQRSSTGFWYFYPVALALKTPLAFLALLAFGIVSAVRARQTRWWIALAFATGILAVGMFSRINIGVRHVLPIYLSFSILAAGGAMALLERRWVLPVLLLWFAGASLSSHPDYLPYFNLLAGSEPEKVLVDSDLDWGQDLKRLGHRLAEAGAEWVVFTQWPPADLQKEHGFPLVIRSDVPRPSPGWNAVSVTVWKEFRMWLFDTHPEVTPWPDTIPPQERVGKSILLWYFPPGANRPAGLER